MQAKRMMECLETVRWAPATLAQSLQVEPSRIDLWIGGREEIPIRVASWLEALCFTHEASELMRPSLASSDHPAEVEVPGHRREHVPAYSYGLLRQLSEAPVSLNRLFGTDDEAAVFFLVSRGLAEREGAVLKITADGLGLGEVAALSPAGSR